MCSAGPSRFGRRSAGERKKNRHGGLHKRAAGALNKTKDGTPPNPPGKEAGHAPPCRSRDRDRRRRRASRRPCPCDAHELVAGAASRRRGSDPFLIRKSVRASSAAEGLACPCAARGLRASGDARPANEKKIDTAGCTNARLGR